MTQTLITRHDTDSGASQRLRIVAGDRVDEVNRGPSYSGSNGYMSARLVTSRMRRSAWYRSAQFDDKGNSDWL